MTDNPISEILSANLGSNWTIEEVAEQLLDAIAASSLPRDHIFALSAETTADCQARRLLRPLLACLSIKSAAEVGSTPNLYGGNLSFRRSGPSGAVWIVGHFENVPGGVRIALERSVGSSDQFDRQLSSPPALSAVDRVAAPEPQIS